MKGPFLSTFSAQDTVVGKAYSIMSRLAGDNTREIGDASTSSAASAATDLSRRPRSPPHAARAGTPYDYQARVINNLDGSGGLIKTTAT